MTEKERNAWHRECAYAYFWKNVSGFGKKAMDECIKQYGSYEAAYREITQSPQKLKYEKQRQAFSELRKTWDVSQKYDALRNAGIHCVPKALTGYPAALKDLPDAPDVLFVKGKLPDANKPLVALIGARNCTNYGIYVAKELGKRMACEEIGVISGMARGIDGIGQWAALTHGGATFGVLGSGVDVCYPKENDELYHRLCVGECGGGIISEFLPKTEAKSGHFPVRNRIISGLADAVVVIEAKEKSGTFITVERALEQGKDVYAVPGRLTDPLSIGCLKLIEQGADLIWDFDLFLEKVKENKAYQSNCAANSVKTSAKTTGKTAMGKPLVTLSGLQKEIYEVLDFQYQDANEILCKLKEANIADILSALSDLECKKIVEQDCGFYRYVLK